VFVQYFSCTNKSLFEVISSFNESSVESYGFEEAVQFAIVYVYYK
jgi:hypothetical protein